MLFDKLCGIVEKNPDRLGMLVEPLREAKLFVFDRPAHEIATAETLMDIDWDLFCLPYRVTAIEDAGSVILIVDAEDDVIGLNNPRFFVEVMGPVGERTEEKQDAFADNDEMREISNRINALSSDDPYYTISISTIDYIDYSVKGGWKVSSTIMGGGSYYTKTGAFIFDFADEIPEYVLHGMRQPISRNAKAALEEIAIALGPSHFVVESSAVKPQKPGPKIPRSHQRPIYTALKPTEIRKRLGLNRPEHQGGTKAPHERRRHPRRLSTEGGHFKQDRIVIVKASWIGPSEAQVGNKRYKVILD